jgi:hypothetical protein
MNKLVSLFFLVSVVSWAEDSNGTSDATYSYFTLGSERVKYEETASLLPVTSSAEVTNSIINTGGLYNINDKYAFSIDALATFSPNSTTEEWSQENIGIYQQNQFEYNHASTNILVHYKLTPNVRLVAGGGFSLTAYERSGVDLTLNDGKIFKSGVIEEKSTEFYIDAGIAYESGNLAQVWRYGGKATFGIPIWAETTNTLFSGLEYDTSGYRANIEGSLSYRLLNNVHLGLYARAFYMQRDLEGPFEWSGTLVDSPGKWRVELPEGEVTAFSLGLTFLWNL